jgi:salicylate hydroxylase
LLYRLATEAGARVEFGVSVVDVLAGDPSPTVVLADGRRLTTDLVIGADGPTSVVRRTVLDADDDAEPSGYTAFGGAIPAAEIMKDPELTKYLQSNEVCDYSFLPRQAYLTPIPVASMDGK